MSNLQPTSMTETRRNLDIPISAGREMSQMGAQVYNSSSESSRRPAGISPAQPNNTPTLPSSQMMLSRSYSHSHSNSNPIPSPYRSRSRSRSQSSVFGYLPPWNGHQHSITDTPLGFSAMNQSSPQFMPFGSSGVPDILVSMREKMVSQKPIQPVKRASEWNDKVGNKNVEGAGERISEGQITDAMINVNKNLDNNNLLNSIETEENYLDGRASGRKRNGGESSDNGVLSELHRNSMGWQGTSLSASSERRGGVKRSGGGDIAPTVGHYKRVAMERNAANESLTETAISDHNHVKRLLSNPTSAAHSKEEKMRFHANLEEKLQAMQAEETTLSAQINLTKNASAKLINRNDELKFSIEAMEKKGQLKDALNKRFTADCQRLKELAQDMAEEEAFLLKRLAHGIRFN